VALRRAAIEVVLGDAEQALARLGPLLEDDPFDAAAHLLVARASELLGRPEEARAHAREALSLSPGLAEAQRILEGR
jgi:Tfp pilus assembly protein PilF